MTDEGAHEDPPEVAPVDLREEGTGAALTIADAARAAGTDRHSIRRKLHAGQFPNAFKDTQGFWRIYESDLLAADVPVDEAVIEEIVEAEIEPTAPAAGDNEALRLEIVELRHRVATAEALLAAERRLSEELARALQVARRTGDALIATVSGPHKDLRALEPRPAPAPPQPRANWQAELRAARARELQARAAREREERQQASSGDSGA